MRPSRILLFLSSFLLSAGWVAHAQDWPWWRGPDRNGVAQLNTDAPFPTELREATWRTPIPGKGHGSVIVAKDRVFVCVAEENKKRQSLICLNRVDGSKRWQTTILEGSFTQKLNTKGSWASTTPATDGDRIFVNFQHGDAAYTTAVNWAGKILWQKKICAYKTHQNYASSPAIFDGQVIVSADNKKGGAVVAFAPATGEELWRVKRRKKPNYPSPIILEAAGKEQLFLTGTDCVTSLDPRTGKVNWEIDGATTECVTSTVTDGKRIYSSGGYPKNHVAAIRADGSGKVDWEVKNRVYVPSMLIKDGHLFGIMDIGVAVCWDSATGEEKWKGRLGGTFSASPILVGDRIFAINESGVFYAYRANAEAFELLHKQKIADQVYASPVICGGKMYVRVARNLDGKRQEEIVCY